jgi:hypothetical protein
MSGVSELANTTAINNILDDIKTEFYAAQGKFPAINSPLEGWAVIWEELEELRLEAKEAHGLTAPAREEAIQVAAMALRYIYDLIPPRPCDDCARRDLQPVEHEKNEKDWSGSSSSQSYQVYQCQVCGDYWGCRHQYDAGTGNDDRWYRFGPDLTTVRRHY